MSDITFFLIVLNSLYTIYLFVKSVQTEKRFDIAYKIFENQISVLENNNKRLLALERNSENAKTPDNKDN